MSTILDHRRRANIRHILVRVLTGAGHDVSTAEDGVTGARMVGAQAWDLVILDLLLPDLPGTAVLSSMLSTRPAQKVMVLSCVGDTETRVSCLERGAVDFIVKPFSTRELLARVESRLLLPHLPSSGRADRRRAYSGSISTRRTLELDGLCIELSPRESLLVQHLMRQQGEVCTRVELLQQVWDYAFEPDDDVVDLTVQGLRNKLPRELIRTVGHAGYALTAN